MWIQLAQNLGNAQLDKVMKVGCVHIVLGNEVENRIEFAIILGNRLVDVEATADEYTHYHRQGNGEG